MVTQSFPITIEEIKPEWLTETLRRSGVLGAEAVVGVEHEVVGEGVGILCSLARLRLTYNAPAPNAPRTVVVKVPRNIEFIRALERRNGLYEREVRFYRELAANVPLRTPRCYGSELDSENGDFVLLLEDLGAYRTGDQVAGCSLAEADLAVSELARLHAAWWQSPRLSDLCWLPRLDDPLLRAQTEHFRDALPVFLEMHGARCPDPVRRTCERLADRLDALRAELAERPETLCHGDFRLDNLFFGSGDGQAPLVVCDWQLIYPGAGALDLAYFLSGSIDTALRRQHEQTLIRRYCAALYAGGVRGYDLDDCLADYRRALLRFLAYWVLAAITDMGNARGNVLRDVMTERSLSANLDWRTAELLEA